MKPQTADNLRCLAAAIFVFAVLAASVTRADWFLHLPEWILIPGFLALLLLVVRLFNVRRSVKAERVLHDNVTITNHLASGEIETVRWDDLQEVGILTTDDGPWAEDVYWMLLSKNDGCAVPGGAQGMKELLARLQQLPGFNNEAVIKAMGSTTHNKFVCWRRGPESPKAD
jgi:hypothetical protein